MPARTKERHDEATERTKRNDDKLNEGDCAACSRGSLPVVVVVFIRVVVVISLTKSIQQSQTKGAGGGIYSYTILSSVLIKSSPSLSVTIQWAKDINIFTKKKPKVIHKC